MSATTFREDPGLSNSLRNSILVDNVVAVLPGMVDGGNTNDNYDRNYIAYILKPFAITHASCRQNERVLLCKKL